MNYSHNIPSIFHAESAISDSETAAPNFVLRITAAVLGGLIAEPGLINYDDGTETLNTIERIIAKAVDASIENLDMAELTRAYNVRDKAIFEAYRRDSALGRPSKASKE